MQSSLPMVHGIPMSHINLSYSNMPQMPLPIDEKTSCTIYVGNLSVLVSGEREREFFIDNLLVRIHLIIVKIRWTGLAPWESEFPFPGERRPAEAVLHRSHRGSGGGAAGQRRRVRSSPPWR